LGRWGRRRWTLVAYGTLGGGGPTRLWLPNDTMIAARFIAFSIKGGCSAHVLDAPKPPPRRAASKAAVSVSLPAALLQAVDQVAQARGLSRSAVVAEMLRAGAGALNKRRAQPDPHAAELREYLRRVEQLGGELGATAGAALRQIDGGRQ
jgi:predicted transcriptional regulator